MINTENDFVNFFLNNKSILANLIIFFEFYCFYYEGFVYYYDYYRAFIGYYDFFFLSLFHYKISLLLLLLLSN